MNNSLKRGKPEEINRKKIPEPESDELYEIEKFIRKKRLQNQVLKELSKEIESSVTPEETKTGSNEGPVS